MSSDASTGGRAGHEQDHEHVDKDVAGEEPVEREREGEYTDSDVDAGDTDPPVGSYTDRDVSGRDR